MLNACFVMLFLFGLQGHYDCPWTMVRAFKLTSHKRNFCTGEGIRCC